MVEAGEEVQGFGRYSQREQSAPLAVWDDVIAETMTDQQRAVDQGDFPKTLEPLGREQSRRKHRIAELCHLGYRHERRKERQTADRELARHAGRHTGAKGMAKQDNLVPGYALRRQRPQIGAGITINTFLAG